jgi:hypothetical protein
MLLRSAQTRPHLEPFFNAKDLQAAMLGSMKTAARRLKTHSVSELCFGAPCEMALGLVCRPLN